MGSDPARAVRRLSGAYGAARRRLKAAGLSIAIGLLAVLPAQAQEITVAALGDSLTQGFGLPPEQGFVPVLEAWLRARGHDATLVNAGVSGDTTAGGLSRVDWTLTPEVDAMIVALGGNDVLRGIDPAVSRANLDGILETAGARDIPVLLVGITAPGNYGPDYKRAVDEMYPALAAKHGALLEPDFLSGLQEARAGGAALGALMQPDGVHPSAAGVALIVDRLGPKVAELVARAEAQAGG